MSVAGVCAWSVLLLAMAPGCSSDECCISSVNVSKSCLDVSMACTVDGGPPSGASGFVDLPSGRHLRIPLDRLRSALATRDAIDVLFDGIAREREPALLATIDGATARVERWRALDYYNERFVRIPRDASVLELWYEGAPASARLWLTLVNVDCTERLAQGECGD